MPKNRERSIDEFNKNLYLLKVSISSESWGVISKFIGSNNKIRQRDFKKFVECIHDVDAEQWAKYLRKLRDNEYEDKRTRISISDDTKTRLEKIKDKKECEKFDEVINLILDENFRLRKKLKRLVSSHNAEPR